MMKRPLRFFILPICLLVSILNLSGQNKYSDSKTILQKIESLGKQYPSLCSKKSLVKTAGGKEIIVLSIGTGDKDNKPAIAIMGGIDGSYLLGRELAVGFAENLLKESATPEISKLLNSVTFYVFPDISPDASDQFFSAVKYERSSNTRSTDEDKDFSFDEDPYEDLNNDGFITLIRVSDPLGTFIESEDDKRVLVAADLSKGEFGSYRMFTEGIDNDKDDSLNEDGPGGVNINRNFTFNYEEFGLNSGLHAVSEPETKAVADFLYDHFNIYMTIAFGPQDNLGQPLKASEKQPAPPQGGMEQGPGQGMGRGERPQMGDRRITAITKSDEAINKLLSDKYHEITGIKGAPVSKSDPGNFMDWAYFHYGRYSYSTPGWWFPAEKGKNTEIAFLKFAEKNKMTDVFVPWTEVKHPDYPNNKTEVGGIKPFIMANPPADSLGILITRNYKFVMAAAEMHPELEFLDTTIENAGENVFSISLKVHNKGIFATCTEAGNLNLWTRIMRINLEPAKGQTFLSGQKVQRIQRLEGDASAEFSWLISGKGTITVSAGALNVGTISTKIELK
jgi:hypothetical protein